MAASVEQSAPLAKDRLIAYYRVVRGAVCVAGTAARSSQAARKNVGKACGVLQHWAWLPLVFSVIEIMSLSTV